MRNAPYLAILILVVAAGFGWFFSHGSHPGQGVKLQCLIPAAFNAGQSVWTPDGQPGFVPAWSVVPITGWDRWTCGTNGNWSHSNG